MLIFFMDVLILVMIERGKKNIHLNVTICSYSYSVALFIAVETVFSHFYSLRELYFLTLSICNTMYGCVSDKFAVYKFDST